MDAERWRRIEGLFQEALGLAPPEREALLARECAGDPALLARVQRMLTDDDTQGDLFDHLDAAPVDPVLGSTLGAWRPVERIAVGGMGAVYRAERVDGLFEQEVAIKLIRGERVTPAMVRRFERERSTLAALQHPGIARLFDGGTSAEGRPYLVMELVRGVPIDRYCRERDLPLEARVRLFVAVCRAVHFAHQNLVVHRDLKPGNVLVDERGAPKLLDFGIAHLLQEEGAGATPPTLTRARLLTPEYAAPEQLAGGPTTTAVDVYALGVVLCEILTGRRPFDPGERSAAEWERVVREDEPPRPSTLVATTDAARAALARVPASRLRGDLDRIVLMALRKEPERRYRSASELADDLERHLRGEPVLARPNSFLYRSSRFVKRNRVAVAAALAVLAALLAGLVATVRGEHRARELARDARIEADSFEAIAQFLSETFLTATIAQDPARLHVARESVVGYAERVRRQYADADPIRAHLLRALGQVCTRLDLFDEGRALLEEALALFERTAGSGTPDQVQTLRSLGQLEYHRGDYPRAAEHLERALAIARAVDEPDPGDVAGLANDLAACLRHTDRDDEARRLHEEALALRRALGDGLPIAESLNNLSALDMDRGEFATAVERLREARDLYAQVLGEGHELVVQGDSNLAAALWQAGDHEAGRAHMRAAEAGYRALQADGEGGLATALSNLAWMEYLDGQLEGAEEHLGEALDLSSRRVGMAHPATVDVLSKLAVVLHAQGRDDEARALWDEVLELQRAPGVDPRVRAGTLYNHATFLTQLDAWDDAQPLLEESLEVYHGLAAVDPLVLGRGELLLARCLARGPRAAEAREHFAEALAQLEASGRAEPRELEFARRALADGTP